MCVSFTYLQRPPTPVSAAGSAKVLDFIQLFLLLSGLKKKKVF